MCGFLGIVGELPNDIQATFPVIAEMIKHRGPDQFNTSLTEDSALASARLIVVDPAGGTQPCTLKPNRTLVYNGEIFNFNYEDGISEASSASDTENLYHFLGNENSSLSKLEGQFAFAHWNYEENKLILARDRHGEKPLYYADLGRAVVFGSSADAVAKLANLKASYSKSAITYYLINGHLNSSESIYTGVRQLPPGFQLIWTQENRNIQLKSYLPVSSLKLQQKKTLTDESISELDSIFREVVSKQLVADTKVGVFLSGGLDSSLIAYYASKVSPQIETFSVELAGQNDDVERAEKTAKLLGLEHTSVLFGRKEFNRAIEVYQQKFDTPVTDSGTLPLLTLIEYSKKNLSVALSGEGGDELFAGYPWAYSRFENNKLGISNSSLISYYLRIARKLERKPNKVEHLSNRLIAIEHSKLRPIDKFVNFTNKYQFFSDREINKLNLSLPQFEFTENKFDLQDALKWDRERYLTENLLVKADRASMAFGFEVRLPFLAHSMEEFAKSLDEKALIDSSQGKIILRKLAARVMPELNWDGKKYGLGLSGPTILRFIDIDDELEKLLRIKELRTLNGNVEATVFKEMALRNSRNKWMTFMLLKWFEVRI